MSGIGRRSALRLLGVTGAAGVLSACAPTEPSRSPVGELRDSRIRIGLLVPRSGPYQRVGEEIVNGFRRYLRDTDNRLGGHPVVELIEDEGDSAESARAGLDRLLGEEPQALVGLVNSQALPELTPVLEEAHVPLLSAYAAPADLSGSPYVWRTSAGNRDPGLAVGAHLAETGSGPVAVVAQDDPVGNDAVAGLREALAAADGEDRLVEPIVTTATPEPGDGFFDDALGQVSLLGPEAVFCAFDGPAAVRFVRQYLAAGLEPDRLYGPAHLTEGAALTELGADALGVQTAASYAMTLRGPANRAFTVAYRSEFGPPTVYAVAGHDAGSVLDTAIRLVGDEEPAARDVNLMLGEVGLVDSPRGRWQFNQNRAPTQTWYLREVAYDGPVLTNLVVRELGTIG